MRFHCGISFSWKTIKKFLIPILLGLLAYFGFNFIYDSNTPLGFIKVNALENYNNSYTLTYEDLNAYNEYIDNTYTFKSFVDYLKTLSSSYYSLVVSPSIYKNGSDIHLKGFSIMVVPKSTNSLSIVLTGQKNTTYLFTRYDSSLRYFTFNTYNQNISDIINTTSYTNFFNCYYSNLNCTNNSNLITSSNNIEFGFSNSTILVDIDNSISIPFSSNDNNIYFSSIYYSEIPVILSSNTWETNNYIFKSITYNGDTINFGEEIPTIVDTLTPTPEPEPEPTPDEDIEHKAIFNKIYWFDDNTTSFGVLCSIYILLFLYTISMILLRILTLIKNTRWK